MYNYVPFKKIQFFYTSSSFGVTDALLAVEHEQTSILTLDLLPEDLSDKSKGNGIDTHIYNYNFKLLNPTIQQLNQLSKLKQKKCFAQLTTCTDEVIVIGNYDEPVQVTHSNIDSKTFKNVSGLKLNIRCESLVLPSFI